MTTYHIHAPHFVAAVVSSGDTVIQAAPLLERFVSRPFLELRDYCQKNGWAVEPTIDEERPTWLEISGIAYELHWNGSVITRVTMHQDGEPRDLHYSEMPEQLKQLL